MPSSEFAPIEPISEARQKPVQIFFHPSRCSLKHSLCARFFWWCCADLSYQFEGRKKFSPANCHLPVYGGKRCRVISLRRSKIFLMVQEMRLFVRLSPTAINLTAINGRWTSPSPITDHRGDWAKLNSLYQHFVRYKGIFIGSWPILYMNWDWVLCFWIFISSSSNLLS